LKKLNKILPQEYILDIIGDKDVTISGLELDSRKIKSGGLFAALPGTVVDGHTYIQTAINNGAVAVICKTLPDSIQTHVTYIQSDDPSKLLGLVASAFYDFPSSKMDLIGVTGTNGKTTTVTLLYQLFKKLKYKCGLIATTEIRIDDKKLDTAHTTPDVITLNRLLAEMVKADCEYAFMEVSSHAVVQDRIFGLEYKGGIFTNLTHDHLDYHVTFENYRDAKKLFFDHLDLEAFALTNVDDKNGKVMIQNSKAARATYGLLNNADFKGKIVEYDLHGMQLNLDGEEIYTHLSGKFNAYNLLAVYAAARLLDVPKDELVTVISSLTSVEGRFNFINSHQVTGIVDYAHTPDALQNILESINEINVEGNHIITVVGCGGNRDKSKRPVMGKIAADYSYKVILTSDNPRNEDPEEIIKEMEGGIPFQKRKSVLNITDRKQAIKTACAMAQKGDIILVAGKGHEKYQEIKGVKYPFDDKEILTEMLNETRN
jgi:UDP-N-acetylmuramoyl-L-alanyl-D-glutamate--2,6-diaminopimelate ligase